MRYVQGTDIKVSGPTAVTLGKFDGMHCGHQELLQALKRIQSQGMQAAVFTFGTSPYAILRGEKRSLLMTSREKAVYCEQLGIDLLVEYPFTEEVCRMSAEDFIRKVLVEELHARYIIVGTDFGFGYRRQGNVELLKACEAEYGYETIVLEKRTDETGREISSTYVREMLLDGKMEKVEELLGAPYTVEGPIIHGQKLGRRFGFPTINVEPEAEKLMPPYGVYASRVFLDGVWYNGVTNVGVKPTVSSAQTVGLETFLFDFSGEVYGEVVAVELLHYLRPEQKFDSLEALEQQISRDSQNATEFLKKRFLIDKPF